MSSGDINVVATLSLVDNPDVKVQTIYACDASQLDGQIGLRSHYSDASFDNLKIEYLPKKIGSWKLGGEIESSFEYLLDETNKDYDVYRFVVPVLANFSIMKEIKPEKMYAGIRAGGGLSFLCNKFVFNSDMRSDSKFLHVGLAGDAQLCARYFINRSFVVELNSSCKYFRISGEDIISVSAGGLLGWRF